MLTSYSVAGEVIYRLHSLAGSVDTGLPQDKDIYVSIYWDSTLISNVGLGSCVHSRV